MFLWSTLSAATPQEGQEAVLIRRPILFGHGGVVEQPVKTGRQLVALSTRVVYVDMRPMQKNESFDDLMSLDGIPLHFESAIRLRVTDSVRLIERFGESWYENNVQAEFRNRVRQAVRKHGMNETAISTVAIEEIDREVSGQMRDYLQRAQIPVELLMITVGRASPPDSIKNQRIQTASEQQRRITEEQTRQAEVARLEAERARAMADNAYRESLNLSPEQFVALERIKMERAACVREGNTCTFVTGVASPIIAAR